jgi:hypothetical protein
MPQHPLLPPAASFGQQAAAAEVKVRWRGGGRGGGRGSRDKHWRRRQGVIGEGDDNSSLVGMVIGERCAGLSRGVKAR